MWALREAVRAGHESDIRTIVDHNLSSCIGVGIGVPEGRLPHPSEIPASMRLDPREEWSFTVDSLTKRLRTAAVDREYIADVDRRAWDQINGVVARYEEIHGEEHPVRAWERGEVVAAVKR